MGKVETLVQLLKRLSSGKDPEVVKGEVKEFLATIDAGELNSAEQKLMEAGLVVEDLRHLCLGHLEVLGDQLEGTRSGLEPGHVLRTLFNEHDSILTFLSALEGINQEVQAMGEYAGNGQD